MNLTFEPNTSLNAVRVERKDAHGNAIDFTGLLQMGETILCVKNNHVDDPHVFEGSNEGANADVYETSDIGLSGFCLGRISKVRDC